MTSCVREASVTLLRAQQHHSSRHKRTNTHTDAQTKADEQTHTHTHTKMPAHLLVLCLHNGADADSGLGCEEQRGHHAHRQDNDDLGQLVPWSQSSNHGNDHDNHLKISSNHQSRQDQASRSGGGPAGPCWTHSSKYERMRHERMRHEGQSVRLIVVCTSRWHT